MTMHENQSTPIEIIMYVYVLDEGVKPLTSLLLWSVLCTLSTVGFSKLLSNQSEMDFAGVRDLY